MFKNKNGITFRYFCMILILSLSLLSCTKKVENKSSLKPIKLAAFQLYVSGLVVASNLNISDTGSNCFEQAELSYEIIKRSKGPEIVDALVGGSADFGTLANTPVVLQVMQGSELVIFATIQTTNHDIKVIGHRNNGINSPESLKGKRIGFVGGTIGEIFLDRYLEKYNVDKSSVVLTSAGPAQLRDLFLNKSLDGIVIWEPIIQDILRDEATEKDEIYLDIDSTLYDLRMHLVAKPNILKEKRLEAQKLIESMICGEEVLKHNPEIVQEKLEKWLDRQPGTLNNVFEASTFRVELNIPILLKELKEEAEWANESIFSGMKDVPENFIKNIDASILMSISPERVIE